MSDYLNDPVFWKIYHSGDEEWPGYKALSSKNASLPLLISEIYRLIPYIGSEYVQFHPKNMPQVKIEKIEIVGIVTEKLRMAKYTSYTVDDGTGAIFILCSNKAMSFNEWKAQQKSSENGSSHDAGAKSELKVPLGSLHGAAYTYERHIFNLWYKAKDEELSHNEVLPYDYVHVIGFCAMSLPDKKPISEVTDEDVKLGRLFIYGLKLRRIGEAEHNAMLKSLITQDAGERYVKPEVL